jgi:hypothetical protein
VFTQINTLPYSKVKLSVTNGDTHRTAKQRGLDVGGHVVVAFIIMEVVRGIFWYYFVEMGFKILTYGRVSIFVDGKAGRSMLDEHMKYSDLYTPEIG